MRVEGYAATFEPYLLYETDDYTIYEQISPGAFRSADMRDVVMLFNHDGDVLARTTNNTLQLNVDNKGLHVVARLDGTQAARNRFEEIKGEYLTQMSFAFIVNENGDRREVIKEEPGHVTILRTILSFKDVRDVSVVTRPANPGTDIAARELTPREKEELRQQIKQMLKEREHET